jgi:hypothetical protein
MSVCPIHYFLETVECLALLKKDVDFFWGDLVCKCEFLDFVCDHLSLCEVVVPGLEKYVLGDFEI